MTFANPHEASIDMPLQSRSANRGFRYSPNTLKDIFRILDGGAYFASAFLAGLIFINPIYTNFTFYVFAAIFCACVFSIVAGKTQLYAHETIMRYGGRFDDLLLAGMVSILLFLCVTISLGALEKYDLRWIIAFVIGAILLQAITRLAGCGVLRHMAARRLMGRTMAVLGVGEQAARFLRRHDDAKAFFTDVVGVFDPDPEGKVPTSFHGRPVYAGIEALLAAAREHKIDDIVVTMPWNADREVATIVERLKELPVNVYLSTDLVGFELTFTPVTGDLADLPVFEVIQRPISGWSSLLKRIEDYVLAGPALIFLSPLLLLIAVAIKLDSPGPVFFKQRRLGFNNQEFEIYKFRSMYHHQLPEHFVQQASKSDPRITRVGRIIRKTSLDELPQLFNVLNGSMSLVGPRPHAISHNAEYGRQIRGYFARHKVKPGITGWAQVNGLRGETETLDKMEARIHHDVYYADNWSLLFDIRIIVQTVGVFLFQKTAY